MTIRDLWRASGEPRAFAFGYKGLSVCPSTSRLCVFACLRVVEPRRLRHIQCFWPAHGRCSGRSDQLTEVHRERGWPHELAGPAPVRTPNGLNAGFL